MCLPFLHSLKFKANHLNMNDPIFIDVFQCHMGVNNLSDEFILERFWYPSGIGKPGGANPGFQSLSSPVNHLFWDKLQPFYCKA